MEWAEGVVPWPKEKELRLHPESPVEVSRFGSAGPQGGEGGKVKGSSKDSAI